MIIEVPARRPHPDIEGRFLTITWVNDPDMHDEKIDEKQPPPLLLRAEDGHARIRPRRGPGGPVSARERIVQHTSALGASYTGYIMGSAEKPTAIPSEDRDYLRDVYYNHTLHPASSGQ